MKQFEVFVVEDNEWYRKLLTHALEMIPEVEVTSFDSAEALFKKWPLYPDLITLDYRLPDATGDQVLQKILATTPETNVVVISEQQEIETAVSLLKAGAYDYLVKSDEIRNKLRTTVHHLMERTALIQRVDSLEQEVNRKYDLERTLVANSAPMQQVIKMVHKAIQSSITVTITGETGTGKEVIAKTIHYHSKEASGPFVAVNMAAIPNDLMESELFGHEKGAFTGAVQQRVGRFEEANGGTLFLDEIGEMDVAMQAKILRALQEREITRVGGNSSTEINARIIVATHQDLPEMVRSGKFREDLYYRIAGLPIELPSLRSRRADIIPLAKMFSEEFCQINNQAIKSFSEETRQKLQQHHWPGNIRELKSAIELAVVMAESEEIQPGDIVFRSLQNIDNLTDENLTMRQYEIRLVQVYMKRFSNNTKAVADALDIGQTTVYRLLKEANKTA